MAVFLTDPTILVVNDKFSLLVAADPAGDIDSILFDVGVLDSTLPAAYLNIPAASRQPPAASRQPPAASRQPPAASRQPPAGFGTT